VAGSLADAISSVLETAESLLEAGPAANEANTKQHLIDPLLRTLGWNVDDWKEVDREFKVYDGTFLDYALRIDAKPKLFLEAKAIGKASLTNRLSPRPLTMRITKVSSGASSQTVLSTRSTNPTNRCRWSGSFF
jgi:hypothetical protein